MNSKVVTPPREDAWHGAQLAVENVAYHRSCADLLADHEKYGAAINHLVLATEESVKALGLLMSALGLPMEVGDARTLFRTHQGRHLVAALTQVVAAFVDRSVQDLRPPAPERFAEGDLIVEMLRVAAPHWTAFVKGGDEPELVEDVEWWRTAEERKQRGTYVDFVDGGWKSPHDVTETDYLTALAVATRFLDWHQTQLKLFVEAPPEITALLLREFGSIERYLDAGGAEELGRPLIQDL